MPRRATGTRKHLPNGRWQVSVPAARGASKRRTATFDDETQAMAWQAACLRALAVDSALPDPDAFRPAATLRRYVRPDHPVTIREYASAWHRRLYEVNHHARGERTRQVQADLDNHIVDFFDAVGLARLEEISPQAATDLARYLGGWPLEYHEASRAKPTPLSRSTAQRVIGLFKKLMAAAVAEGHLEHDPTVLVVAMGRYGGDQVRPAGPPLTLEDAVQLAALLPPTYQLALWLMRLVGLRIGEVFGPRVRDVIDSGHQMLLLINQQGGRLFEERDEYGRWVRTTESSDLKTRASYRVIPVPDCLAEVIRVIIDAYHTDPDTGSVAADARLIPGVRRAGASGMHNLRARLQEAAAATGIRDPQEVQGRLRPHQLRGAAATDIHVREDAIPTLQQRFLGHRAGDTILLRHYLLDDPESRGLLAIRDAIEADVRERIGDLIVPTAADFRWGLDNPIRGRLGYVETVLSACGWRAAGPDDDWLSSAKVACLLGIHPSKARERMADGRIPGTLRKWGTRDCWFARRSDIEAYLEQLSKGTTVEELATQLGLSYHQTYQELTLWRRST